MIMTHKQDKFGEDKRLQIVNPAQQKYKSPRALLLSSEDVDRMAVQSSRARLINHLVSNSQDHYATREFASYYRGPTRYLEPPYSITSHTNRVYSPKALQLIPAYPSLVPVPQWCPYYRQMPEQNSETDLMMGRKYNCRCVECHSADCPARTNGKFRPRRIKDNIMTFCDQCTMTPNLNDVSCGTPTPSTVQRVTSTGAAAPCDAAESGARDHLGKLKIYEMCNKLGTYTPMSILKKGYNTDPLNNDCRNTKIQEVVNESEPLKSISVQYFYNKKEDDDGGSYIHSTRKNLYNEGISDVALKFPSVPKKDPRAPPATPAPVRSKSRVQIDGFSTSDVHIPHSHRTESRYHKHCADMSAEQPKNLALVSSTRISPCKICSLKQTKQQQQRNIKLPKKVLTSEKLTDTSIIKTKAHCTRKKISENFAN